MSDCHHPSWHAERAPKFRLVCDECSGEVYPRRHGPWGPEEIGYDGIEEPFVLVDEHGLHIDDGEYLTEIGETV